MEEEELGGGGQEETEGRHSFIFERKGGKQEGNTKKENAYTYENKRRKKGEWRKRSVNESELACQSRMEGWKGKEK